MTELQQRSHWRLVGSAISVAMHAMTAPPPSKSNPLSEQTLKKQALEWNGRNVTNGEEGFKNHGGSKQWEVSMDNIQHTWTNFTTMWDTKNESPYGTGDVKCLALHDRKWSLKKWVTVEAKPSLRELMCNSAPSKMRYGGIQIQVPFPKKLGMVAAKTTTTQKYNLALPKRDMVESKNKRHSQKKIGYGRGKKKGTKIPQPHSHPPKWHTMEDKTNWDHKYRTKTWKWDTVVATVGNGIRVPLNKKFDML